MIAILSPAKNMRTICTEGFHITKPKFLEETSYLLSELKKLEPFALENPMKINSDLAMKAFMNFQDMDLNQTGTAALLAYHGLQYKNLNPYDFDLDDLSFAKEHLKIISAFYGVLSPNDGIHPYRLEMECRLKFDGKNLYQFWGEKIYQALFQKKEWVINLTSQEYAKTVLPYLKSSDLFLTCQFVVHRKGKYQALATDSKMARGQMARYIVKNRITDPQKLKCFTWNQYAFVESLSDEKTFTFVKSLF